MVNISIPELKETKAEALPPASIETLERLRDQMCTASKDFKLQANQRFLRRVLSPDSPTRNLLMVHGTGVGKTCTAIQIAEEYIVRPEFQDKRVFVLANPAVQENFKNQIIDVSRVDSETGAILPKQCTGRRYIEMIQRLQAEPIRLTDRASQIRVANTASRIIDEFYEFQGYNEFANVIKNKQTELTNGMKQWIEDTFSNRLIIIDEAHNLRESTEIESNKLVAIALEEIIKVANGVTLVLLTATPMYDSYDEIMYYFNLFLWNDRKLDIKKTIPSSQIFTSTGDLREGKDVLFRGWCQEYVSYVKGENPFTFPFRLPPPEKLIALTDRETDVYGDRIEKQRKFLVLTRSFMSPYQAELVKPLRPKTVTDSRLICAFPDNKTFRETFDQKTDDSGIFEYKKDTVKFLAPSKLSLYSSKFALITNIFQQTTGLAFVYSNIVEYGAKLFAMCLEEHGFEPAFGPRLLKNISNEVTRGSKGKYALFTAETSDADIKKTLLRIRSKNNMNGSDIRVLIASPKVSEGVDFRYIRQIHVLDPWFNMSRIEQVLGRGMRTCSHAALPFKQQNCTVYLHVNRYPDSKQETLDEYMYRVYVEEKAIKIAKVKRYIMESAMDCELQLSTNVLPNDWRNNLKIPQIRSQDGKELELTISQMSAPNFEDVNVGLTCNVIKYEEDKLHTRPLSAIVDVRDEILDKLSELFKKKPIWTEADLLKHQSMRSYEKDIVLYIIEDALQSGFMIKDSSDRIGFLESKDSMLAFATKENQTLLDRTLRVKKTPEITVIRDIKEEEEQTTEEVISLERRTDEFPFPTYIRNRFDSEILQWYIIDHVLSRSQQTKLILSSNWNDPPIYAAPLETVDGVKLYITGPNDIYNSEKEKIEPVGEEEDSYRKWVDMLVEKFIDTKDSYFASMKEDSVIFNLDEKTVPIKRADRKKNIGGRACISYSEPVLNNFSEWLVGEPFPEQIKTKKERCMYLDLLIREAVRSKKEGIVWWTPQEWNVINQEDIRKDLLKRIKE